MSEINKNSRLFQRPGVGAVECIPVSVNWLWGCGQNLSSRDLLWSALLKQKEDSRVLGMTEEGGMRQEAVT